MTASAEMPRPDDFEPKTPEPAGWLTAEDIAVVRAQLPVLYIDAVPVRVDECGDVIQVGVLLRMGASGLLRCLVSGRVMYHERVRDALVRHLEKDLGPVALPQVPPSPQPFTVAEYFPTPGITPFHDPRQHAVSLAYVVPVAGDCLPQQDAIDIAWLTPEEACSDASQAEFANGQGVLVRQAMAWVGRF